MITESLAKRAIRIHDNAFFANKRLAPKGASPLSALVASINSFQETGSIEEIVAQSFQKTSTIGTYAEIEDEIATNTAKIISRIIHLARNIVNPKIKECIEEVEKWKLKETDTSWYSPMITQIELEDLFTDEMFCSSIKSYSNSLNTVNITIIGEVVKVLDQALLEEDRVLLLSTGTGSLDAKITDYLNKQDANVSNFIKYDYNRNPVEMGLPELVCYYFFLNGVCTGRSDKVLGVINNSIWLAELCNLQANIGNRLNMVINRFTKAISDGELFVPVGIRPEWIVSTSSIAVIGKNYREWLQNKGTPESLIGYIISKRNIPQATFSSAELKEKTEYYTDLYSKEINHKKVMRLNEEHYRVPQIIGDTLTRIINKGEEEDNIKINLINKVKEAIKCPYYGSQDLQAYARDIVCSVYTDGDDVKMVLSNIDSVLKETGNNDLEYAVNVSIRRLVGRFIARQIDVIKQ